MEWTTAGLAIPGGSGPCAGRSSNVNATWSGITGAAAWLCSARVMANAAASRNTVQRMFPCNMQSAPCNTRLASWFEGERVLENFRLRVFREVANQASFRRAAEVLYITQPAVTQQIKALEEELGSRLFDRNGGKVRLTAAGEVLLRRAGEAESILSRAIEEIGTLEGDVRGALHVAASTTIAQYVLPRLLAEFARQHPAVRLELESANTQRVVEAVASGEAPIGLIEGPAHRQELQVERWLEDELVLVVPSGHEWAGKEISLTALGAARLLVRERGSGTRE